MNQVSTNKRIKFNNLYFIFNNISKFLNLEYLLNKLKILFEMKITNLLEKYDKKLHYYIKRKKI